MKLRKILIILTLSLICSLCFFGACQKSNKIVELNIKQYSAQMPIEVPMGNFIYENYTLVVTYDNGDTKEIPLSQDMIGEVDKLSFYKEGLHTVTINYQNKSVDILIDVKRNEFEEAIFEDVVATYTGQDITMQVGGNIPSGTTILYPQGNVFSQAGEYEVSAVLIRDTFVTKKLNAKLTINKADYDLSKANLYDKTVVYNGENHFIELQGVLNEDVNKYTQYELPNGVTFSYSINGEEGNSAKDAGVYTITASFVGNNVNYNAIPDKKATLTIQKASFDISGITFVNKTEVYDGYEKNLEITNKEFLPDGIIVSYEVAEVLNASSESLESAVWEKGNSVIDAGLYAVKANFSPDSAHSKNYQAPQSQIAFIKIEKAIFDTSDIKFEPKIYYYTGEAFSVSVQEELPYGIKDVEYEIQLIIDGQGNINFGEVQKGNEAVEAGLYYIVAELILTDAYAKNYNADPSYIDSYMSIEQAEIDLTSAKLGNIETEYAEEGFDLKITGLPEEILGYDYKILDKDGVDYNKEENYNEYGRLVLFVGEYTLSLDVYIMPQSLNNFRIVGENSIKGAFVVNPKKINLQDLNYKDKTVIYESGKEQSLLVQDCPKYLSVSYKSAEVSQVGESVSTWTDTLQYSKEGIFAYKAIFEVVDENYTITSTELVRYLTVYDLEKIDFNLQSCQKVYSGEKYELVLPVEFPQGITVEYKIHCNGQEVDSAIEVGEYTFTAVFGGVAQGVENKTATLTIVPKPYDLQNVVDNMQSNGLLDAQIYSLVIGQIYNFNISSEHYDSDIIEIAFSHRDITVAGDYSVTITFSIKDKNYTATNIEKVVTLRVVDLTTITYYQTNDAYTGNDITFAIEEVQVIPQDIRVEYYLANVNGFDLTQEEIDNLIWRNTNKAVNSGIYLLKVNFVLENQQILHQEYRYFMVQKATIKTSLMIFNDTTKYYTAKEISVKVGGEVPSFVKATYTYRLKSTNEVLETLPIEVGEYLVEVELSFIDDSYKLNYNDIEQLAPITLTIEKETLNFTRFQIEQDYVLTDLQEIYENQTEDNYITITVEKSSLITFIDNDVFAQNKAIQVIVTANGSTLSRVTTDTDTEKIFRVPNQEGTYQASITIVFENSDFYTNVDGNRVTFNFIIKTI